MFLVAVSGSGGGGGDDLSETNSSMLKRRVEDLNYKAEKVSVKVEIFVKLFGIMLLFNVRRVLEDSRRVEEELVFTVRNQKVWPDNQTGIPQISWWRRRRTRMRTRTRRRRRRRRRSTCSRFNNFEVILRYLLYDIEIYKVHYNCYIFSYVILIQCKWHFRELFSLLISNLYLYLQRWFWQRKKKLELKHSLDFYLSVISTFRYVLAVELLKMKFDNQK